MSAIPLQGLVYWAPKDAWEFLGYADSDPFKHTNQECEVTPVVSKPASFGPNNRVADLEREARRVQRELDRAREYESAMAVADELEPKYEIGEDPPVIMFSHQFDFAFGRPYTFVAVRIRSGLGTKWYVTDGHNYTWRQLAQKFREVRNGDFWVVTEWGRPV